MKKLTKSQLLVEVAERSGSTKKEVADVLAALHDVVVEQLKGPGVVTVPDMVRLTLKDKPATPERQGINPFTKEPTVFKAKPASKTVKVVPVKALKDSVA